MTLGILFSFLALLAWGFGDFFIQRAVRVFGDVKTLFYIGATGAVTLFPFIQDEFFVVARNPLHLILLLVTGVVIFAAALFDFEALRRGKIAIVEPVIGLELPIAIVLSVLFIGEQFSLAQTLLAATTFLGIVLAVTIHHAHLHYHRRILERGVVFAVAAAIIMGLVNFLVGVGAQETSPLMTIWFTSTIFTALCLVLIAVRGRFHEIVRDVVRHPGPFVTVSVLDNAAWIFFAYAASHAPISIVTTISESYIALTVLLGFFVNREKIRPHQLWGVMIAIASVILLAAVSG